MTNDTKVYQNTAKDFDARMEYAERMFYDGIQAIVKCTRAEAEKVLRVYRKLKITQDDPVFGEIKARTRRDRPFHEVFIRAAIEIDESTI